MKRLRYVQGNPVKYTDPFGLSPEDGKAKGNNFWHCYFVGEVGVLVQNMQNDGCGVAAEAAGSAAGNAAGKTGENSGKGGSKRFDRVGYQSGGRSNNLFGKNSYSNAQVLSRYENIKKYDK